MSSTNNTKNTNYSSLPKEYNLVDKIKGSNAYTYLKGKQEDDIVIAQLMTDIAEWDYTLDICIPMLHKGEVELGYHAYRCRIDQISYSPAAGIYSNIDQIIDNDIMMMNKIHNLIHNGQTDDHKLLQEQVQN